ncbi:phage tail family protein [Shouchella clausii]|uniref:phage tail family protein n=1 Tax=Shouchella clausii TaxID=79880 RepID=UPI00226C7512|nr:phage tail family protein [Shouchella clausii]
MKTIGEFEQLDLYVQKAGSSEAPLSLLSAGIVPRDFIIESPELMTTYEEAAGLNGSIDMGAVYGKRYMVGDFYAKAADEYDFHAMRDEIFALFNGPEPFYITESREPGKRWLVRTEGRYSLDRQRTYGFFQINFVSASPFAESIVRTSENEFRFDSAKLQFSQGIPTEPLVYRFTTPSFRVYNAGDVTVDWRSQDAVLTFKGASTNLRIRNLTSGADWRITDGGQTTANDTVRLERGCRALRNGLSIVASTNLAAFTLAPGWNEIRIEGSSGSIETAFDFRFLYL